MTPWTVGNVIEHRHVLEDERVLGEQTNSAASRQYDATIPGVNKLPADAHPTTIQGKQSSHDTRKGRLPRPVRPHDGDNLAGLDIQPHVP